MTGTDHRDVEKLVAQTFGHVRPAPAIEEEILDALSPERATPRRPLRWLAALPLAAAVVVAIFWPGPDSDRPAGFAGSEAQAAVYLRLARGGLILIRPEGPADGWVEVTLDGLAKHLRDRAKAYDEKCVAKGKSGYEDLPHGVKGSTLRVVLSADRDTPWQHAQWWMTICAQERFRVGERGVDRGDRAGAAEPEFVISMQVEGRAEKPVRWGGREVVAPTRFFYRFLGRESEEVSDTADWLGDALKAVDGAKVDANLVKAGHKIPVRLVADLLARYREHGIERVRFFGTAPPPDAVREAPRLPYPTANYPGPDPTTSVEVEGTLEEEVVEEEPPAKPR